jgi:Mn2+/Fe2+ NRAMP family transporter
LSTKNKDSIWSGTKKWWLSLGPSIITAALVFGPGSLTITSKLGSLYQYDLLWVLVVSTILMITFTGMGARIGIATEQSLLLTFRDKWGKWASILTGLGIFFITASFQAGNSIGAGISFAESFQTSAIPWIILISLLAISLLFFKSFYKVLEKVMILMVSLMLLSFLFTLMVAQPGLDQVLAGLIPTVPTGAVILVIAMVASSFSIAGAFYQSYLVQERGWQKEEVKKVKRESFSGILILGIISSMILVSSGAILHPQGIAVNAATDMGKALEPLYGSWATGIFMLGLFGASFSSLIGNATIGGTLFADALSLGRDLNSRPVKLLIMLVIFIGAFVAIAFGKLPLELIVFAQGVTIFVVPFIGLGIFLIANNQRIMGDLVNKTPSKISGLIGLVVLVLLAASNFYNLFL